MPISAPSGGGGASSDVLTPVGKWVNAPTQASGTQAYSNGAALIHAVSLPKCRIDGLAANVGFEGSAGARVRCVAWADSNGLPGAVVADTGRLPADVVGGGPAIGTVTTFQHPGGRLWLAAIPQGAPATNPQLFFTAGAGDAFPSNTVAGSQAVSALSKTILDAPGNNPATNADWTLSPSPPRVAVRIAA